MAIDFQTWKTEQLVVLEAELVSREAAFQASYLEAENFALAREAARNVANNHKKIANRIKALIKAINDDGTVVP